MKYEHKKSQYISQIKSTMIFFFFYISITFLGDIHDLKDFSAYLRDFTKVPILKKKKHKKNIINDDFNQYGGNSINN